LLKSLGIECFDELRDYTPNEEALVDGDARNQAEFMKNLMRKYGSDEKKCFLCNCNIQRLIIASHIHRVCDINRENITFMEKRAKAVSGDNGLWLCANHDKLFEYGLIYFDENGAMKVSDSGDLTEEQKEFVEGITIPNDPANNSVVIAEELLTEEMKHFLSIHRQRTHPELY
jgi:predicted restriction endonuclease